MEALTVEYEAVPADVEAFHRHHMSSGSRRWIAMAGHIVILLMGASLVVPTVLSVRVGERGLALLLGFIAFLVTAAGILLLVFDRRLTPKLTSMIMLANPQNRFYALGHRVVSVDLDGICVAHGGGSQAITWDGVYRVDRDAQATYIYTTPRSAFWLPRRAFNSSESFDAAYSAVTRWHEAARATGSRPPT